MERGRHRWYRRHSNGTIAKRVGWKRKTSKVKYWRMARVVARWRWELRTMEITRKENTKENESKLRGRDGRRLR